MHVVVFGSSTIESGDARHAAAVALGMAIAGMGLAVATGGYGGLMAAVSRGAAEAGGQVIGVTAPTLFPDRPGANRWVGREIAADGLLDRIEHLLDGAIAVVALPGSLGTFAELVLAWNLVYVGQGLPICALGWSDVIADLSDRFGVEGITTVADVEDAIRWLASLQV